MAIELMNLAIGALTVLLVITMFMSYLMYVRLRDLQREVQELRNKAEITNDELDNLESNLQDIKQMDMSS